MKQELWEEWAKKMRPDLYEGLQYMREGVKDAEQILKATYKMLVAMGEINPIPEDMAGEFKLKNPLVVPVHDGAIIVTEDEGGD